MEMFTSAELKGKVVLGELICHLVRVHVSWNWLK